MSSSPKLWTARPIRGQIATPSWSTSASTPLRSGPGRPTMLRFIDGEQSDVRPVNVWESSDVRGGRPVEDAHLDFATPASFFVGGSRSPSELRRICVGLLVGDPRATHAGRRLLVHLHEADPSF